MTVTVQEAQAQLEQAKAAQTAEANAALRKQLAAIRAELRQARTKYTSLSSRIRRGEQAIARIQAQVDELTAELTLSMEQRPPVADCLPDDSEVAEWRRNHEGLVARRSALIRKRESVASVIPPKLEAARYEGQLGLIARLEMAQHNLIRRIKGEPIGESWEGGVYRVL